MTALDTLSDVDRGRRDALLEAIQKPGFLSNPVIKDHGASSNPSVTTTIRWRVRAECERLVVGRLSAILLDVVLADRMVAETVSRETSRRTEAVFAGTPVGQFVDDLGSGSYAQRTGVRIPANYPYRGNDTLGGLVFSCPATARRGTDGSPGVNMCYAVVNIDGEPSVIHPVLEKAARSEDIIWSGNRAMANWVVKAWKQNDQYHILGSVYEPRPATGDCQEVVLFAMPSFTTIYEYFKRPSFLDADFIGRNYYRMRICYSNIDLRPSA